MSCFQVKKDNKFNSTVYKNAYNKSHYIQCKFNCKPEIAQKIADYCTLHNISKSAFFVNAALYAIDNNLIFNDDK